MEAAQCCAARKAALTRPKKNNTGERLRRQFSTAADKAVKALNVKGRNSWLRYGYNEEVVVTAKLGCQIIPVTGDEALALPRSEAEAYLKDVIDATNAGQLDRQLLGAAGAAPAPKRREPKPKTDASVDATGVVSFRARAPAEWNLKSER